MARGYSYLRTSSLSSVMVLRTVAMDRELMYTLSPHLYAPLLWHTAVLPLQCHAKGVLSPKGQ